MSATSWQLFQVEIPVADRIALSRFVFDVLARWTLKNDQTYDMFDTSLMQYLLILCYDIVCIIDYARGDTRMKFLKCG